MSAIDRQTVINGVRRISGLGGVLPINDRELLKFAAGMLEADGKELAEKTRATAHWWYDPDGYDFNLGCWRCSACGYRHSMPMMKGVDELTIYRFDGSHYCPYCGAAMRYEA